MVWLGDARQTLHLFLDQGILNKEEFAWESQPLGRMRSLDMI